MRINFLSRPAALRPAAPPRRRNLHGLRLWLLMLPCMLLAVLLGAAGGMGSAPLVMIIGGAIFAVLLFLLVDFYSLFLITFVVTFVVQGTALYFLGLRSATWVAVGMAILFFCRVLLDLTMRRRRADSAGDTLLVVGSAGLFVLCFGFSLVLNRIPVGQIIAVAKAMLPMFGVLFALFWIDWGESRMLKIWRYVLVVTLLQLPVVLLQHFVYGQNGNFDSVVGTFGGQPGSGGNSAVLVLFTIATVTLALARWNAGLLSRGRLLLLLLIAFVIILSGEVKAAFLWMPIAVFWVLRKRILSNLFAMAGYSLCVAVFMFGTYQVYNALYWGKHQEKAGTIAAKLDAGGGYFFDPNNVNYRTGEISRGASVALWLHDQGSNLPHRLVGFGPGASRPAGVVGAGSVALRYAPLHIDASTVAVLLWDTGLLGALAYGAMMLSGIVLGWRHIRLGRLAPPQMALLEACVPMLVLFTSTLLYNRALMDEPTAQLLFMLCLGTVVQLARYGAPAAPAPAPAARGLPG